MLGFLFFSGFTVWAWFRSEKKIEDAMGQQKKEAAEKEGDSEASVSDYEVFLSFRGPDSRQGLADVLYNDMRTAGIHVFRDDDELDTGDEIGKILPAIKNSKICVPIFSSTFAASAWCLREVEKMVELKKKIMPIFYTATPEDVKLGTALFKKELRKHEKKHGKEQVKKWEEALKVVARIKGREVKTTGHSLGCTRAGKPDLALVRLDLASLSQIGLERLTEGSSPLSSSSPEPRAGLRIPWLGSR
ncbi:hypothetical protein CDL15_Pgr028449 [Punica granatum]|uniref:ADP-ribosyl cyclase/cyclic ADP-ribose hydrolase n=1 Tax=Punica granatum TaxID=22663 RepID=A0A218W7L2_PUNGR|nr:hypothetical protein CDL15_Pgr028449 [Punica granatum]